MDHVEVALKRKITELLKTWLPVMFLMGLLITIDFLDSPEGESFLSKVTGLSSGLGTQKYHDKLPALTVYSNYKIVYDNHGRHEQFWKARHLLQRPTPPSATPLSTSQHLLDLFLQNFS